MNPANRRRGPTSVLMLAGVIVLGSTRLADSQTFDCDGLRRRIAGLDHAGGGQAARYVRSARRQQAEIERTRAYRRSLGCDRQSFSMFGGSPAQDCYRVDAQIERMNANLAALQQSATRLADGDSDERSELVQRYEVYCRQPSDFAALVPGGFPDRRSLPDDEPRPDAGFQRMPLDPGDRDADPREGRGDDAGPPASDAGDNGVVTGGAKAVCVKTCDGSFFPVSYSASRGNFASLEALCHASCPNAETKLYTYDVSTEIAEAVDKEGKSYAELPNANRYSKVYDATCSCRAPGKTWLETLAEAERLYAGGEHDIVVTRQMSEAFARAAPVAASKVKSRTRRTGAKHLPDPAPQAAQTVPTTAAKEPTGPEKAAAQATGIDGGMSGLRGTGEGGTPETKGGDGKRRVRIIAPNL